MPKRNRYVANPFNCHLFLTIAINFILKMHTHTHFNSTYTVFSNTIDLHVGRDFKFLQLLALGNNRYIMTQSLEKKKKKFN